MGKKKSKNKKDEKSKPRNSLCVYNFVVTLAVFLLVFTAYKIMPSYKWVVNSLAYSNMQTIKKYPNLHIDRKYEAKLGFDYKYINYVRNHTPENAVILMPPGSEILKKNFNKKGAWGVKNKVWNTYFLYPRILVDQDAVISDTALAKSLTHVMIVNGWGYDKLEYHISQKAQYNVLPIRLSGGKR
ncbi:MAG: hypothetical protein KAT14_06945 [Candidatus Marinimicrobia bacterium]|nr:hypothetical protein [Candidatus Neomarinimicrobiota bacterium]